MEFRQWSNAVIAYPHRSNESCISQVEEGAIGCHPPDGIGEGAVDRDHIEIGASECRYGVLDGAAYLLGIGGLFVVG